MGDHLVNDIYGFNSFIGGSYAGNPSALRHYGSFGHGCYFAGMLDGLEQRLVPWRE